VTTTPGDRRKLRCAARRLAEALRTGSCPVDHTFDRFLPEPLRVVSPQYWSPLAVAKRAAEWLDDVGVHNVVDIGSGAGKFCVAGALFGRCHFIGLEQRVFLVDSARALARLFDVNDRVRFVRGALGAVPAPVADAYYLFNPFGQYWFEADDMVQTNVEFGNERLADDVAAAEQLLRRAPVRTWLLTYNGFGGRVPDGYELLRVDWELPGVLRLWRKERHRIA
jgi:hypothetical protein